MKKTYFKMKMKLIALVMLILIVGSGLLTYQRATAIRENILKDEIRVTDFVEVLSDHVKSANLENITKNVYKVLDSRLHSVRSDVSFYCVLKDANGEILAQEQNFILIEACVGEDHWEQRVILLGDDHVTADENADKNFADGFLEQVEITGTCDDTFIYLDKLAWMDMDGQSYSYIPEESKLQGTVKFEEWAGSNRWSDEDRDMNFTVDTHYMTSQNVGGFDNRYTEAKEICDRIYTAEKPADRTPDWGTQTHEVYIEEGGNLFTYYKYGNDYIANNRYTLSFVYVFHPVSLAMAELFMVYCVIAFLGILSVFFICFTVNKLYKQQLDYEMNRRQLTRAIAHELKTPIAIVDGYVENWEYMDEQKRSESAKAMKDEIKYMDHMVTDLLELSRLEAKAKEIHPEIVDVPALTQSVVRRMKDIIEERNLTVHIQENIPEDKYLINADLEMMRIVLSNFLSNAVKYAEKEISIAFLEKDRNMRFIITYDGGTIGYKIEQVWDEFYKGDRENYSRMGSSGLGLAITKNILILHHAGYGCESRDGKTSFWFEMKLEKM